MKSKKNIKSIVMLAGISIVALFFINISFAANTAKVSVETANLRETADTNSKILELLSQDQEVTILEKEGEWYKVKAQGITGYLRQDVITLSGNTQNTTEQANTEQTTSEQQEEPTTNQENQTNETETPKTNTENENQNKDENTKKVVEDTKLKIVPAINATETIEVKKDQEVTIIEKINGWVCIEVETVRGWIREDKLKSAQEEQPTNNQEQTEQQSTEQPAAQTAEKLLKTLYVNTETINLRQEANTTSEIVAKLKLNTTVEVYEELDGWYRVKVEGKAGYISASLLSDKKQEVTSRSSTTPRQNNNTNTNKPAETQSTPSQTNQTTSKKGATVVQTASNYIGSSYVYGAAGPNSFDCSGFTSYVYRQHGINLNRTAAGQYSNGTAVARSNLQPGDLVMFGKSGINHVGIYIGGGNIVHAANRQRGVTIDTINSGYYNNNYVGARRVIQ